MTSKEKEIISDAASNILDCLLKITLSGDYQRMSDDGKKAFNCIQDCYEDIFNAMRGERHRLQVAIYKLKRKAEQPAVNANTMLIYNSKNGTAPYSKLSRGYGRFSRQANTPPFCKLVRKGEKCNRQVSSFFRENPTLKCCYVCDCKAVEKWLATHPNSKMNTLKN